MTPLFLFDFDGVVVDSFAVTLQAFRVLHPEINEEGLRALFDGNFFAHPSNERQTEEERLARHQEFVRQFAPLLLTQRVFPSMDRVIADIAPRSITSIVSSGSEPQIRRFLSDHGLEAYFVDVLGAETNPSKKEKNLSLLKMYNVAPANTVFITDTLGDIQEAHESGIEAIGVTWGFHERERLAKGNPRAIVDTPEELKTLLETFF